MKFLKKIFGQSEPPATQDNSPSVMGLRLGGSFELDPLMLKLNNEALTTDSCSSTHIIEAAGKCKAEGETNVYRFYTDDEAWLEVTATSGTEEENVTDVKLYHFYESQEVADDRDWDDLLENVIGAEQFELNGSVFTRSWGAVGDRHRPVHLNESTFLKTTALPSSNTDVFIMLYERETANGPTEYLMLSAEEQRMENGDLGRHFITSTGVGISPTQLTING